MVGQIICYSQILDNLRMKPKVAPNPNAIAATWKFSKYNATDDIIYAVNLATPYNVKSPLDSINSFLDIFIPYLFYDLKNLFVSELPFLIQLSFPYAEQLTFVPLSDA